MNGWAGTWEPIWRQLRELEGDWQPTSHDWLVLLLTHHDEDEVAAALRQ